jgi:excisionase family DNA binding protein
MNQRAYTVKELQAVGGPGRAKAYEDIRAGKLRAVKLGRSTRILADDFERYLASLPPIEPKADVTQPAEHGQAHGRRRRALKAQRIR